jgi:hypothetical protein
MQMYDDAMQAIHNHLIQTSSKVKLTYTSELIPERHPGGEMYVLFSAQCTVSHLSNLALGVKCPSKITSSASLEAP